MHEGLVTRVRFRVSIRFVLFFSSARWSHSRDNTRDAFYSHLNYLLVCYTTVAWRRTRKSPLERTQRLSVQYHPAIEHRTPKQRLRLMFFIYCDRKLSNLNLFLPKVYRSLVLIIIVVAETACYSIDITIAKNSPELNPIKRLNRFDPF